ncbi:MULTISPECIES: AI-2E family transporter [Gammaproteobacteria]|uniref:AI-2E family transporter n=1 Tax=Gammaproteobacteria TaxID=1236 RepID=UPI000DCFB571|nr:MULTISPECIES: AI-2E family transporter [Gammaproteobacteria]RTE87035.1 AI-2E family transporter [Aliidiomarina sp. B3213]TCZ93175.1 AI-2E family transporter [Lysobacter sp. N42]
MLDYLKHWFQKRFSDPNLVALTLMLVVGFVILLTMGSILAPVIAAIALAYLLEWPVSKCEQLGLRRLPAALIVFAVFMTIFILLIVFLVPVIWQQSVNLLQELPLIAEAWQDLVERAEEIAPSFIEPRQIELFTQRINNRLLEIGQSLLDRSLGTIYVFASLLVYLIIVPLMVFFMLKDKDILLSHFERVLPEQRRKIQQVGYEMNTQIMNYIRGKSLEIIIVGIVTFVVFSLFELQYAALLATLVGFSVLVPYIGAAVVTIPVALVGLFQFGPSITLVWLLFAYLVIQALDGNVLVPLLFSEAVSLHPVYIIASVLIFGAMWGFWGVFFAIPLASLVKAVLTAFSQARQEQQAEEGGS